MKTMLRTDLIQCKGMLGALGPMLLMLVVINIINFGRGTIPVLMFTMMTLMVVFMLFAYDEKANWNRFLLTMPIKPFSIVAARYLLVVFGLLLSALFAGAIALLQLALGHTENIPEIAYSFCIALVPFLVSFSISFPIMYKFGVEKARILSTLSIVVPFFAVFLPAFFYGDALADTGLITKAVPIGLAVGICLFVASLLLSVRIVTRKEW